MAHALTVSALSVGWHDHRQSKMRSQIRDHRHCELFIAKTVQFIMQYSVDVHDHNTRNFPDMN